MVERLKRLRTTEVDGGTLGNTEEVEEMEEEGYASGYVEINSTLKRLYFEAKRRRKNVASEG